MSNTKGIIENEWRDAKGSFKNDIVREIDVDISEMVSAIFEKHKGKISHDAINQLICYNAFHTCVFQIAMDA